MNYLIRDQEKLTKIILKLELNAVIDSEQVKNLDDIFFQIERRKNKDGVLENLMKKLISDRLKTILSTELKLGYAEPSYDTILTSLIPKRETSRMAKQIVKITGWKFPTTVMTARSVTIAIVIFVAFLILVLGFLRNHVEIFLLTFNFFSISFLFLFLLLPGIILIRLMPHTFDVHEFYGIKIFGELIDQIFKLNSIEYEKNNYFKSKEEFYNLYGPL